MQDPRTPALLIPFVIALLVTWLGLMLAGRGKAADFWPALGLAAAVAVSLWVILGALSFPPQGAVEKLAYIVGAGALAGVLMELIGGPRGLRLLALVWPWLVVGWIAWPKLQGLDWHVMALAAGVSLAGSIVMAQLWESRGGAGGFLLVVAALALGGVALYDASFAMARVMAPLGAGLAGAALGAWASAGGRGFPLGGALLIAGGGLFVAQAAILLLYTPASVWPVAFLIPLFFAEIMASRVAGSGGGVNRIFRIAALLICALAPAVGAVLLAQHL
ncbi:MAG: hypothetical protein P8X75_05240 [Limibacillus sp.]